MSDDPAKSDHPNSQSAGVSVAPVKKTRTIKKRNRKDLPLYNVVLLDDNDHTVEYVIEMLKALFAHPAELGMQMAQEVNDLGRVIVYTTHKEHAELKRDQIHAYGTDVRVATCKGSMSATIEPADIR
jgi:ATP-dependent Clp protease adaptor protein ClpS